MKLVLNTWLAFEIEAAAEAAALATRLDIAPTALAEAIHDNPLTSAKLSKIQRRDYDTDFSLEWALKDLELARDTVGTQPAASPTDGRPSPAKASATSTSAPPRSASTETETHDTGQALLTRQAWPSPGAVPFVRVDVDSIVVDYRDPGGMPVLELMHVPWAELNAEAASHNDRVDS